MGLSSPYVAVRKVKGLSDPRGYPAQVRVYAAQLFLADGSPQQACTN